VLRATRKKKLLIVDERSRKVVIDGGYTGKMQSADGAVIDALLERGFIPVVSPVAMGDEAEPLNVDSDRAAAYLAVGTHADAVLFLTDVKGLKLDGNVVEGLTVQEGTILPSEDWFRHAEEGPRRDRGDGGRRQGGDNRLGVRAVPSHGRDGTRRLHRD
jgi:acetylglutamate kinase